MFLLDAHTCLRSPCVKSTKVTPVQEPCVINKMEFIRTLNSQQIWVKTNKIFIKTRVVALLGEITFYVVCNVWRANVRFEVAFIFLEVFEMITMTMETCLLRNHTPKYAENGITAHKTKMKKKHTIGSKPSKTSKACWFLLELFCSTSIIFRGKTNKVLLNFKHLWRNIK